MATFVTSIPSVSLTSPIAPPDGSMVSTKAFEPPPLKDLERVGTLARRNQVALGSRAVIDRQPLKVGGDTVVANARDEVLADPESGSAPYFQIPTFSSAM